MIEMSEIGLSAYHTGELALSATLTPLLVWAAVDTWLDFPAFDIERI